MPSGPLRTQNRHDATLLSAVPVVLPGFDAVQVVSPGWQPARPIRKSGNEYMVVLPRSIPLNTMSQLMCSASKPARMVCLPCDQETVSAIWNWSVGSKTSSPMPPPILNSPWIVMGFMVVIDGLIGVMPSCVVVNGTPLLFAPRFRWNDNRASLTTLLDISEVSFRT